MIRGTESMSVDKHPSTGRDAETWIKIARHSGVRDRKIALARLHCFSGLDGI